MTFQGLYDELNRRLHGSTSNAAFLTALKAWINLARNEIVSYIPNADFLQTIGTETLIASQLSYVLATDIVKINPEEVRLTTNRTRIYHLDPDDEGYISALMTPGTPSHFRLAGYQAMQLYPPPSSAAVSAEASVTYEYTKNFPTDMSATSDVHGLPFHLENTIVDLAEAKGWLFLRRVDNAQFAYQRGIASLSAYAPTNEFMSNLALNLSPKASRISETTPPQTTGGKQ